jgi:predicted dehydrogenase
MRAGVIGLGIGRLHMRAYQALPEVELVAVADVSEEALDRARAEFGVPQTFTDYWEMLDKADVDVVSICTPDRLHAEQALAALAAGKHVLCEKPLATSLEDALAVRDQVQATGRTFMMCHNYRFLPQFAQLKALVEAGTVGDLFCLESNYVQDLYFMEQLGPDYWRLEDPQDFFLGGAVHNVDLLRWIGGEIAEVQAYSNHVMPFYPIDENYAANYRFADGTIGRVLLVLGARLKDKFTVDLSAYGHEGVLKAVMQRDELIQNVARLEGDGPLVIPVEPANSHERLLAHFVASVRAGTEPAITVQDGVAAVAICLATIESARKGQPVRATW